MPIATIFLTVLCVFRYRRPRGVWSFDKLIEDKQLIVPQDCYFVMGDNRDDSSDSRYWGFVPRENIVGRPLLIYFSMRSADPHRCRSPRVINF